MDVSDILRGLKNLVQMKKSFSDPEYVGKSLKPDTDDFLEGLALKLALKILRGIGSSFDHYLLLNTKMISRLILSTSVGRDDFFFQEYSKSVQAQI